MFIIPVIIVSTYLLITRPKAMHHNRERKEIISNSIHGPKKPEFNVHVLNTTTF